MTKKLRGCFFIKDSVKLLITTSTLFNSADRCISYNLTYVQFCMMHILLFNSEFESNLLSLLDEITKGTTVIISHSGKLPFLY